MPYIKLETNVSISATQAETLVKALSTTIAQVTGKPEGVTQAMVAGDRVMVFAGSLEPTAHVEVKGISFPEEHAGPLSQAICGILEKELNIPGKRIYLAFVSYKGSMWGVDGRTF